MFSTQCFNSGQIGQTTVQDTENFKNILINCGGTEAIIQPISTKFTVD